MTSYACRPRGRGEAGFLAFAAVWSCDVGSAFWLRLPGDMEETLATDDSSEAASARLVGTVLDGKYRVERVLGAGGMGYVVAASHVDLGTKVAIKFMIPELAEDKSAVSRFMREARASVRITGEHVARILDVSRMLDGTPYMVMEYLEGCDLAAVLESHGRLDPPVAVDYVLQACEAIAEAHRIGIVHRDLKPSNLFLTQRADGSPVVKVLDFGISKVRIEGVEETKLTATQTLLGSPTYMSPEQVRRADSVDARSDIWTLGVILFELLTDSLPFVAESHMSVLAAVVSDPIPDVKEMIPWVDPGLAEVVQRCLVRDPNERIQDLGQLARELAPYAPPGALSSIDRITNVLARSDSDVTPQGLSRRPEITPGAGSRSRKTTGNEETVDATPNPRSQPGGVETLEAETARSATPAAALVTAHGAEGRASNKRLFVGFAVAVLVVVGGASYALSGSSKGEEAAQPEEPAPESLEAAQPAIEAAQPARAAVEDTNESPAASTSSSTQPAPDGPEDATKDDSPATNTATTPAKRPPVRPVAPGPAPRPKATTKPAPSRDPLDGRF